jgi:hypothetical protein
MTITNQDFAAAKKAVKKVGTADVSLAHKTAMQVLADRCKSAHPGLIQDMGWQVVLAAR